MQKIFLTLVAISCVMCSCSKKWLDERADKTITTPSTLNDLEALLNNQALFNGTGEMFGLQEYAEIGTDNHFMDEFTYDIFLPELFVQDNAYTFAEDIFQGKGNSYLWNIPYKRVFTSNVILENASAIASGSDPRAQRVRGEALFHRAHSFYWLSQIFMTPFDSSTSGAALGIPLRLTSDPAVATVRSSMAETYSQIISTLKEASALLPLLADHPSHPSRAAAYGLLSRVYLSMSDFTNALAYADSALSINGALLDFNTLDANLEYPVTRYNSEVIFSDVNSTSLFYPYFCNVDSILYNSYDADDLRKIIFFKEKSPGLHSFNGSYDQSSLIFGGIATDELVITRAECLAELGQVIPAMDNLNHLLENRYSTGTFTPLTATSRETALELILTERRKELCFRGLRWTDLRRLNLRGAGISIKHIMKGREYVLAPNDSRYTYPIPPDIITLAGIPQNTR